MHCNYLEQKESCGKDDFENVILNSYNTFINGIIGFNVEGIEYEKRIFYD